MQKRFTKLLAALMVLCMMLTTVVVSPTSVAAEGDYTATLSSTTMTESGSIIVNFSDEASSTSYYKVQIVDYSVVGDGNWNIYVYNENVTEGSSFEITKDTGTGLSAEGTYKIWIGHYTTGDTWGNQSLTEYASSNYVATFTVTADEDTYAVSITPAATTCSKGGSIIFTATVTCGGEEITLSEQSDVYLWLWADNYADGHSKGLTDCTASPNTGLANEVTITFPSVGTYYIAYTLEDSSYSTLLKSTDVATITVTESSSSTGDYSLVISLEDSKYSNEKTYKETSFDETETWIETSGVNVYSLTDTYVNVKVVLMDGDDTVAEIPSSYNVYVWFEDDKGDENALETFTSGSSGTIETSITIADYSFSEGRTYNVYARINYNGEEVDGSMRATGFTFNTTYSIELSLTNDTTGTDPTYVSTNYYEYDLGDVLRSAVGITTTTSSGAGESTNNIPTGTFLTIWYKDDQGWESELVYDLGSRVHSSIAYGTNPTSDDGNGNLTLSTSNFSAGNSYIIYAGLYSEGGELLAYDTIIFTIPIRAKFYTRTLTLDGDIGVNYYVYMYDLTEAQKNLVTVDFTVYKEDGTTVASSQTAEYVSGSYRNDLDGYDTVYYRYTVTVDSTQMALSFTAELKYNGTTIQTNTYSVESYCKYAITSTSDLPEKPLCEALLNYGGYAQTYLLGDDAGTLANVNLETYDASWSDPVEEELTTEQTNSLSDYEVSYDNTLPVSFGKASLVLDTQTKIRLYFDLNEGTTDTSGLTFTHNNATTSTTKDDVSLTPQTTEEGDDGYGYYSYYVEFEVQASKLDNTFVVTVSDGSEDGTGTISYSAYAYINSQLSSSEDDLLNVCKALYYYGEAAQDYTDAKGWYTGLT